MASEREQQGFFAEGVKLLSGMYDAVMSGGEVQASIRQGFRELGNAFGTIWPEQIAVVEPGAVFNPLYSDIVAEKAGHAAGLDGEALPSPSAIVGLSNANQSGQVNNRVGGELPSPSQIANDPTPYSPQPDRGQDLQPGREL